MGYKTPKVIEDAVDVLKKLPGVGERTAMRNVLHLLKWKNLEVSNFANAIDQLINLKSCKICNSYCDEFICDICEDPNRLSSKVLCVVETYTDFLAIERSDKYEGLFFILGGVLNPLLGVGPGDLKFDKLKSVISDHAIERVILAINPSLEGEATCSYLNEVLTEFCLVERIGFGVPLGGSLEFLDSQTISTAIENTTRMS